MCILVNITGFCKAILIGPKWLIALDPIQSYLAKIAYVYVTGTKCIHLWARQKWVKLMNLRK